jgi:hypothetical protein
MHECFSERLKTVIDTYEAGNNAAFAKKIGIPATTLHGYLSEDGQDRVKSKVLIRIFEEYDVDANWLLLGEGEMKRGSAELSEFERTDPIAQRMRYAVRLMKEHGGSPEEIRTAITLALKGPEA